ncbi:MAG TPA: PAS domain S-box protein, partial [Thermoanaerobaculia bacterium]|nr:PAS domain S-box protein [Thermoanaerobaculia bacterium]
MSDLREISRRRRFAERLGRQGGKPGARRALLDRYLDLHRSASPWASARRSEAMQQALFRIADLTLAAEDLETIYSSIHQVVGELMDARNFYIAFYDEATDSLSFPYFVDSYDPEPPGMVNPGKTLTAYVLRTGEPLLATPERFAELIASGEVESVGAPSVDWLGVPLKHGARTFGMLGTQSYDEKIRFGARERDILMFVSQHVAAAIMAKRREDAIRESERRYRQMFENNGAVKLVIDADTGSILDANNAAVGYYGYSLSAMRAMKIWDINVAGEEVLREKLHSAAQQKRNTFVVKHRLASGELRDVEVHSGPIEINGRTVLFSILNDVTERVRAEDGLRRSEEYFRTVIENASDLISILDARGQIIYNSPSLTRLLGYAPEKSAGQDIFPLIHPDDVGLVRYQIRQVAAGTAGAEPIEIRVRHLDGTWRTLEAIGRPLREAGESEVRILTNCRDVTERKLADKALQLSEAKFRSIFDFASVGIYQAIPDGSLLTANAALARMLGYHSVGELLEANLARDIFFDPLEPALLMERHAAGHGTELEAIWKRKDGSPVWVQLNAHSILDDQGEILYLEGFVTDIHLRKNAESTLRTQAVAMEASMDGIAIFDADHRLTYVNRAFLKLFRYRSPGDLMFQPLSRLYDAAELERFEEEIFPAVATSGEWRGETVGVTRSGIAFPQEISLTAIENGGLIAIVRDITERTHAEEQIKHLAYHDALTSLPNRLLFKDRLTVAISHAYRDKFKLAVLFLDLDHFKVINDSLGHNIGDRLLQELAKRIRAALRDSDTVARLGGDEFTVLLPQIRDTEAAVEVGRKLLETIRQPLNIEGHDFEVTTSIGVSTFPDDGADAETLIKNADTAMYMAKEDGRDKCQVFSAAASARAMERLALEQGLRKALAHGEFMLYYQPILDLRTGRIAGMEALLRWQHPDFGVTLPGEFLPVAEQTGLMLPIGSWALHAACRQAQAWHRLGYRNLTLSVNLSVSQLQHDLIEKVRLALDDSGLAPDQLELEITESGAMRQPEKSMLLLEELRRTGVRMSLDDFGTGHSSLSYLKSFPIDTIKIDQSFIRDLGTDRDTAA